MSEQKHYCQDCGRAFTLRERMTIRSVHSIDECLKGLRERRAAMEANIVAINDRIEQVANEAISVTP